MRSKEERARQKVDEINEILALELNPSRCENLDTRVVVGKRGLTKVMISHKIHERRVGGGEDQVG